MLINKKKLILIFICLVLGVIVSYKETTFIRTKEVKYAQVVVAKSDIPVNSLLEEGKLEIKDYPESIVNSEFVQSLEDTEGKYALREFKEGTPLFESDIAEEKAIIVPEGMVRVSFSISLPDSLAGAVLPGDLVGIGYASNDGSTSEQLYSDVPITKITDKAGYDLNSDKSSNKYDITGVIPATVTVILKPEEAVDLKRYETKGHLFLLGY